MPILASSAPGRVCLFGEHQDYLGLPVIAAAIGLRIGLTAEPRPDSLFHLSMPDVDDCVTLDPRHEQAYEEQRDYWRACINVLRRRNACWTRGYDITVQSRIPIKAGVSSSSAMVVMWLRFLAMVSDVPVPLEGDELARLGHAAEVAEFGEPGGMMDHFCAAMGGVLHITTQAPFCATPLPIALEGIVLGDSLQDKATLPMLRARRADVEEGVRQMRALVPHFSLAHTPAEELEPYWSRLTDCAAHRLRANVTNRDITRRALQAIDRGDLNALGPLLTAHHEQLRDGLDLSTPKLEAMLDASLAAGARGGKVNGSGGGGCMFAWAPGREQEVAESIRRCGGVPHILAVDSGACAGAA